MAVNVMTAVWERSIHKGSNLLVLLAISDCANKDGGGAYPGTETLAQMTRMDTSSVRRIVNALELSGELRVERRASPYRTNLYTVVLPNLGVPRADQTAQDERYEPDDRPRIPDESPRTGERSRPRTATRANTSVNPSELNPSGEKRPKRLASARKKTDDGTGPRPAEPNPAVLEEMAKHKVPADFQPSPQTREKILLNLKLTDRQIDLEVPDFVHYWSRQGTKRPGWDTSFYNWCINTARQLGLIPPRDAPKPKPTGEQARAELPMGECERRARRHAAAHGYKYDPDGSLPEGIEPDELWLAKRTKPYPLEQHP
jgi:hypothetical protein